MNFTDTFNEYMEAAYALQCEKNFERAKAKYIRSELTPNRSKATLFQKNYILSEAMANLWFAIEQSARQQSLKSKAYETKESLTNWKEKLKSEIVHIGKAFLKFPAEVCFNGIRFTVQVLDDALEVKNADQRRHFN